MAAPFKTLTEEDLNFFRSVCAPERVIVGSAIGEDFCHDELSGIHRRPDAVVKVLSTDEVSAILKYANAQNIAVTPRGQGTGLVGGSVPLSGGVLLDMCSMNHILELDSVNLTLTVEPGVLLMEVAKFAEDNDFMYPPDPGEKTATIGGNISTNAGGMRAVKYGVTRDYVRGLEVVFADGTVAQLGGKVVKNSSGYSLKDLIVGSEGTLAVVTKAILRIVPRPKEKVSLLVPFPNLETAIRTVPLLIGHGATPTAVEFMEREVILASEEFLLRKFPDRSADAYLLLTYDGATQGEVEAAYTAAAQLCIDNGAIDALISSTAERNESIWAARSAFLEAIKASTTGMDECDVVVPRGMVAEFVLYSKELQKKHGVRIRSFGHAGDGNLHIYVLRDELNEDAWHDKLHDVFEELYAKAREFGGKVSGEHGIGYAKRPYLLQDTSPELIALMARVKAAFDPKGILNPGKVFGALS